MNTKKWRTKEGIKIRIKDMDNNHLLNTIALIKRNVIKFQMNIPAPCFQGEMADYFANQEYDRLVSADIGELIPIYDDMIIEAKKRGIL